MCMCAHFYFWSPVLTLLLHFGPLWRTHTHTQAPGASVILSWRKLGKQSAEQKYKTSMQSFLSFTINGVGLYLAPAESNKSLFDLWLCVCVYVVVCVCSCKVLSFPPETSPYIENKNEIYSKGPMGFSSFAKLCLGVPWLPVALLFDKN